MESDLLIYYLGLHSVFATIFLPEFYSLYRNTVLQLYSWFLNLFKNFYKPCFWMFFK